MNNSVQTGQNEKKIKQSHSNWKQEITDCDVSGDKKIIGNQYDLHFYESLEECVASLNLRN